MIFHYYCLAESRHSPADTAKQFLFSGARGLCDPLETLEFRDCRKRQPPITNPHNNTHVEPNYDEESNYGEEPNYGQEYEQMAANMEGNSQENYDDDSFGDISGVGPGLKHHDSAIRSRVYCNSELSERKEEKARQALSIYKAPQTEVRSLQAEREKEEEEKFRQTLPIFKAPQTEVRILQAGRRICQIRHTGDCLNHLLFDTGSCPSHLSGDVLDPCDHVSLGYPRLGVVSLR